MTDHPEVTLLRPARPDDAATVAEIWRRGWHDGHDGLVPQALVDVRTAESFSTRAAERVADTVVAERGGKVVGFVMVVGDEVEQVYVDSRHRGSGLANGLIAEAERVVKANGHDVAWLAVVAGNGRARRFYERSGWVDQGPFAYAARVDDRTIDVACHRYTKVV